MATNYTSEHTGAKIDEGVRKALNPDSKVTEDSESLVTSGAVHDALFSPTAEEAAAILKALGVDVSAEVLNYLSGLSGNLTELLNKKVDNTDIIDVAHGGSGRSSLTADSFLVGNGTTAVKLLTPTEVLTKIGAADKNSYLPLSGGTMTGKIIYPNNVRFDIKDSSGVARNTLSCSSDDALNIGYGLYEQSAGSTRIYGNTVRNYSKANQYWFVGGQTATYAGMEYDADVDTCFFYGSKADSLKIGMDNLRGGGYFNYLYWKNGGNDSDRRKKKNINYDLTELLEVFPELKPVTFIFKDDDKEMIRIGFIAQDLEETFATKGIRPNDYDFLRLEDTKDEDIDDGKKYVVDYNEFTALNTAMIQVQGIEINALKEKYSEQQTIIETLKKEIDTIKATVEKLVETVGGEAVWQ